MEQLIGQVAGVVGREIDVHRQAELDRAGADGHQRANIAVGIVQFAFLDVARRVGRKHVVGLAELFRKQSGEVDGTVQSLAIELPKTTGGFLCMAQEHQRLGAVCRLGAAFAGFKRQKQRAGRQQGRQGDIGAVLETFDQVQKVHHGVKSSSAHSVKADKPLHLELPASGVFHVVKPVRFRKGSAQSPLRPIWFDAGVCAAL